MTELEQKERIRTEVTRLTGFDEQEFCMWYITPNKSLKGASPGELVTSGSGQLVLNFIKRVDEIGDAILQSQTPARDYSSTPNHGPDPTTQEPQG